MRLIPSLLLMLFLTALGGCYKKQSSVGDMKFSPVNSQFKNTDVTGLPYAKDFALTDHNGTARTLADFKGKAVLIFFGYTQCPDVCPTTMAEMATVMKELGPQADKVQVLFVTLDPERDTQELLSKYVPAFDARFLCLYGDPSATAAVATEFKIFYHTVDGKSPGTYTIDHTAGSSAFDPQGRVRLFVRHGAVASPLSHALTLRLPPSH